MNILVKEIDIYKSKKHKGRIISEFIIYLMMGETIIEAHTAMGDSTKDLICLSLFNRYDGQVKILKN
jgi:hypothetical protein